MVLHGARWFKVSKVVKRVRRKSTTAGVDGVHGSNSRADLGMRGSP